MNTTRWSFFVAALVVVAVLSATERRAHAFHPSADCDGAWTITRLAQPAYVHSTAVLEKLENGDYVEQARTEISAHMPEGHVLIAAPWGFTPDAGVRFRVRMETVVYRGLESGAPSLEVLEAWPDDQRLYESGTSTDFECGGSAPLITSPPAASATATAVYAYAPGISAPSSSVLRWVLVAGPSEMIVDEWSGTFAWTPAASDAGRHAVILGVQDTTTGRFDLQAFELTVGGTP